MCVAHLMSWRHHARTNTGSRAEIMPDAKNAEDFLPLRPVEFEVLLVLAEGDSHGYAIMNEAERRYDGARRIETGTLYRALRRLVAAGLIEPSDRRAAPEVDDERRRYFAITPFGRVVASAEARRLRAQVETARARALLSGAGGGGGSA
jgi:DNA-binding PadR family transcriptional regulator